MNSGFLLYLTDVASTAAQYLKKLMEIKEVDVFFFFLF